MPSKHVNVLFNDSVLNYYLIGSLIGSIAIALWLGGAIDHSLRH